MAWTNSKVFAAYHETVGKGSNIDLDAGGLLAALYNNTTAPDNTVTAANSAYAVDQWVVANEVDDGTNWDTGGEPITGVTYTASGTTITLDGTDTPQGGATTTLSGVHGTLVYDGAATTPADQGICYNYFGGAQQVTAGTFTIQWNASGIMSVSVA